MSPSNRAGTTRSKQSLRLWLRLLACENLIEQTVRARLRTEFKVTLPQFDVLSELEHAGQALTMSELSEKLMVSNGNVTGVVDRLERDGCVTRKASTSDRRVQYIALSRRGTALFQKMAGVHETWIAQLFGELKLSEIGELNDTLGKLKDSLTQAQGLQP